MQMNLTHKLIESHVVKGQLIAGQEIGIAIDQTLTQDATGTLVMLTLESMALDRVQTELSVQYVDHNLIQQDFRNPDDHLFLRSACQRFGIWYSPPGNGVSHPVHQERFGIPGKTLLGSDSHTPAAGALGMLAIGAGGMEIALAMAGEPFYFRMPQVWGVELSGQLPKWVSAKDVILELLRRHGVEGGLGRVIEYHGPGLKNLSAMDRHVIANMGTELGATSSVFPSDHEVKRFLESQHRACDWVELCADEGAAYDAQEHIDLSQLEPLIAMPSSPGNVVQVSEVAGQDIYQSYIGSSANPGYRDFAIAAEMVKGKRIHERVSFDVNPTSRQLLANLVRNSHLSSLIQAGARIHQAGCNGCIGMGQAPATDQISLRTVPRNFPGRSGTPEDKVCLVSPETATASALSGVITDPREMDMEHPGNLEPDDLLIIEDMFVPPPTYQHSQAVKLVKGPNIASLPVLDNLPEQLELPVLLKVGDDMSTDEIMPAGARVLPYRSNIPEISRFVFTDVDNSYTERARRVNKTGHAIVAGHNYGQGSSREHAALAPRYLGLRVVVAKSFARIHQQNLVNFGVLPLRFTDEKQYENLSQTDHMRIEDLRQQLLSGNDVNIELVGSGRQLNTGHNLSARQIDIVLDGGIIPWMKERKLARASRSAEQPALK